LYEIHIAIEFDSILDKKCIKQCQNANCVVPTTYNVVKNKGDLHIILYTFKTTGNTYKIIFDVDNVPMTLHRTERNVYKTIEF